MRELWYRILCFFGKHRYEYTIAGTSSKRIDIYKTECVICGHIDKSEIVDPILLKRRLK